MATFTTVPPTPLQTQPNVPLEGAVDGRQLEGYAKPCVDDSSPYLVPPGVTSTVGGVPQPWPAYAVTGQIPNNNATPPSSVLENILLELRYLNTQIAALRGPNAFDVNTNLLNS